MNVSQAQFMDAPAALNLRPDTFRLGGWVDLDGRVSWAPRLPGMRQSLNCYLIVRGRSAILIDTGVAAHREIVKRQLRSVSAADCRLRVFLTRPEPECAGNIGAINEMLKIEEIITVAVNPFDAYEEGVEGKIRIRMLPLAVDRALPIEGLASIYVLPTRVRILSTFWVYDQATKILYSSDWFGHTSVPQGIPSVVIDDLEADRTTYEGARDAVLSKYWWLPLAQTGAMIAFLRETFETYDIETIAPTHGCILTGKPVVNRHLDFMIRLLSEVGVGQQSGGRLR